uniref:Bidirectional sugar transporter SWEET n=1 Tax=Jasminum sambac TaxID=660624 RepID=A0A6G6FQU7_9LAMI|nr:sugar transporter SWEET16 [Jasminum sambac]
MMQSTVNMMQPISFFLGISGNFTSLMIFLAPVGTFWRVIKKGSTEEFESLPYVATLLSSALWTYYGIIKPGGFLVATVNGFGAVVETIYVAIFLLYAPPKMKAKTAVLAGILDVGCLVATIFVTRLTLHGDTRIYSLGFLSSGITILSYCSPLAAMNTVIKTKSVKYMPFFLSFSIFISGGTWPAYAVAVRDYFVGVANGSGFILGAAQLFLYFLYRNAEPSICEPLLAPADDEADKANQV